MAARRQSNAAPLMSPTKATRAVSPTNTKGVRSQSPTVRTSPTSTSLTPTSPAFSNTNNTAANASGAIAPPSVNCFGSFRNFVRVRPFKDKEANTKPPEQVMPRPAIEFNGAALTIVDPAKQFKVPLKNAKANPYESENIIWSFIDPLETEIERKAMEAASSRNIPQMQADVYRKVVEPLFPSILEGYSAAFIVLGAADTGKATTMFGDETWAATNLGLFPRFIEDLFIKFNEKVRGETTLKFEASCVEVIGTAREEKFVDLLKKSADLKVVDTETEGVILEGSARVTCESASDIIEQVKKAVKPVRARKNSSYAITIHITDTTTYKNLENPNAAPKILSRRSAVSFSILRALHSNATFARCVDNAVERDTGVNTRSKPPTRDSCWTRLFADVFLQKLNVTTISCVSPYYEHVKESAVTLEYAKKLGDIRTFPCLRTDQTEVEYRRLADEIHNLDESVNQANQTIQIIQDEIDRCHREYEDAASYNEEAFGDCQRSKIALKAYTQFQTRETTKNKAKAAIYKKEAAVLEDATTGLKAETKATLEATDAVRQERQKADDRIAKIDADINKQKATNSVFDTELSIFTKEEDKVKKMEEFIGNASVGRDEARVELVQKTVALKGEAPALKAEASKAEAALAEQKKKEDGVAQIAAAQRAKKQAVATKQAELDRLKAEIAKTKKEIESLEADHSAKQHKIATAPKGCCIVM
eukprot:GILI01006343.1.p1 GENE.GILI01006343.1~~GILI01006343.1.p1  ORF type:complete len:707 (+),score=173.91 GILI01006343.1:74-2194(+)